VSFTDLTDESDQVQGWPPVQIIVASGKAIVSESGPPAGTRFFSKPYTDHAIADTLGAMVAGRAACIPSQSGAAQERRSGCC
jgi:hypothetical protein